MSSTNDTPIANAGGLQNILAGTTVTLDGSGSSDANGDALSYAWTLTSKPAGSAASLTNPTSPKPTFQADVAGTYVASLVVNDGKVSSQAGTVTVTATVANATPVANAGKDQTAYLGQLVRLDGSGSSDANGDALKYTWKINSYPGLFSPSLAGSNTSGPTFTPSEAGSYVISLVVSDGLASSIASTTTITVINGVAATPAGSGLIFQSDSKMSVMNESTMASSVEFNCGQSFFAIDLRPDGVIVGSSVLTQLFEVNPVSGICFSRGNTSDLMRGISASKQGQLFGVSLSQYSNPAGGFSHRLHKLSSDGSSQSYVYLSGASRYVMAIDFGPDGNLYGLGLVNGGWAIVNINPETGVNAVSFPISQSPTLGDIDIDSSGVLRTIIDGNLHRFDISSGALLSVTKVPNLSIGNNFAPITYVK